jgi:hypothetical protein
MYSVRIKKLQYNNARISYKKFVVNWVWIFGWSSINGTSNQGGKISIAAFRESIGN